MATTQLKLERLEAERIQWQYRLRTLESQMSIGSSAQQRRILDQLRAKLAELDDAILNELEKILT